MHSLPHAHPLTLASCVRAVFVSFLLLGLCSARLSAAVIAYDSFDYAVGTSLATLNGGSGFTSAWGINQSTGGGNGTVLVSPSGITTTPSHPSNTTAGGGIYGTRSFDRINTGTLYFSFQVDNVNDGARFIAFSLMDGGNERAYVGQSGAGSVWGAFASPNVLSNVASRPGVSGMTQLIVKVEFDQSGTDDRMTLFVNSDLSDTEPTTGFFTGTGNYFPNGINGIQLGSGFTNSTQGYTIASFDEVRIATDWASLNQVPEPGRMLLLLCGLAGMALRRRRAQSPVLLSR
ncbi:MAG: PEP-CTERM sorting domain-containing protein [Verrucomicrobium sp.]